MDILEEVLYHLCKNVKTELRVSNVDGIGVFAIRDINEGEQVFPNWNENGGWYYIPNDKLELIPNEVVKLLDKYFITLGGDMKIIKLFKGMNFVFDGLSFCNSAYPNKENINITNKGIALRDIKAGEEILEWYTENIDLANSK